MEKKKAKAVAKPKAKGKASPKAKGKAGAKKTKQQDKVAAPKSNTKKRKSDAAPKKRGKKPKVVETDSPHTTPVKPTRRQWKPSPMAVKGHTGSERKVDLRLQKAVTALGELMDAMETFEGKFDFHGPGPNFTKKFLALRLPCPSVAILKKL